MNYRIEFLRPKSKSYKLMYKGKLSQCFRRLQSVYSRVRIKNDDTGEIVFSRDAQVAQ